MAERRAVRKLLGVKNEETGEWIVQPVVTDPLQRIVLDKRQLALKVTANSYFGLLGINNGKIALIEGAMCITAKGRELINFVNRYLQEKYGGEIIYNDSVTGDTPLVDSGWEARFI